jgi:4-hydroxy-2-oxoheptanedioate aldolase
MADFAAQANAQSLVCVQLEHAEAIANADEILAVDGIDVAFIGPSDLSQSMGHPGNPNAPEVAAAINATLAKIRASNKAPGMPATAETLARVHASGCRYIYTHLPKVLGAGAARFLDGISRN